MRRSPIDLRDEQGSTMAAVLFGVVAAALIATAVGLLSSVAHGRANAEAAGESALLVNDRVQVVLSQLNVKASSAPESRIVTGWMDDNGATLTAAQAQTTARKTQLTVIPQSPANQYRITVQIDATAGHDATASRIVNFQTVATDGAITGVDANGRPKFAPNTGRTLPTLPAAGLLWEVAP